MNITDKRQWLDDHGDIDLDAEYEDGVSTVTFYPQYYRHSVIPCACKCIGLPHDETVEELYSNIKERLFSVCNGP